ncbi:hypothetical protein HYW74_01705 [Candidatus Pacearchaeota archaeon]|nr:hypothetical protein [Candidatus Pacearchaeota archaeon]
MRQLNKKEMYSVIIAIILILGSTLYVINKTNNNETLDYQSFFNMMEKYNPNIQAGNITKEIFFKVPAKVIKIGDDKIQVYEYSSAEEMETEASKISDEGYRVKNVIINWLKPPHFYKKDKLLVLYLGENRSIMDDLEKIVGKEFIGKGVPGNSTNK